jgi:hypothetical protein
MGGISTRISTIPMVAHDIPIKVPRYPFIMEVPSYLLLYECMNV